MMLKGHTSIRRAKISAGALASRATIGARLPALTFDSVFPSNGRRHAWMPNDAVDQFAKEVVLTVLIASHLPRHESWTALALQLPICFEVRALSGILVSSTPE